MVGETVVYETPKTSECNDTLRCTKGWNWGAEVTLKALGKDECAPFPVGGHGQRYQELGTKYSVNRRSGVSSAGKMKRVHGGEAEAKRKSLFLVDSSGL